MLSIVTFLGLNLQILSTLKEEKHSTNKDYHTICMAKGKHIIISERRQSHRI